MKKDRPLLLFTIALAIFILGVFIFHITTTWTYHGYDAAVDVCVQDLIFGIICFLIGVASYKIIS